MNLLQFRKWESFFFFGNLYSFLWGRNYTDRNWWISWPWIRKGDCLKCWFSGEAQNQVEDQFAILMRCNGKRSEALDYSTKQYQFRKLPNVIILLLFSYFLLILGWFWGYFMSLNTYLHINSCFFLLCLYICSFRFLLIGYA